MVHVKDIDEKAFEEDVLARSRALPVVVDFWAPWCGPCRVLGPILEREVEALGGSVELCKLNTDESARLADRYGIQGITAVKAFRDGQVVSEFVGARPLAFVKEWLAALAPSPAERDLRAAESAMGAGRRDEAERLLRAIVDDARVGDRANLALAELRVSAGALDEARALLARLDGRSELQVAAVPALDRRIAFHEDARAYGGEEKARAALGRDPKDLEARYALASAYAARESWEDALAEFLEILRQNRKFRDGAARLAMLAIFERLGHEHDLTQHHRRQMQILL